MILATLARSSDWQVLASALESFGRHSGLFTAVEVRQLGSSESDPFQIQIHIGGKAVNLIDVGYGVSQILPIVVDCLRGEEGGIFLLQQPEVHLHPRAQAELGSFLAVLAKQQKARTLCSEDRDLWSDFQNQHLISKPRGKIYRTSKHAHLLRHTASCGRRSGRR